MVDLSIVMWKFTRGYQWLHHLGSSSNGPSQGLARRMSSLNLVAIVITHGHRPGRIKNDPFPSIVRVSSNLLNIIVHQPEILVISGFIYSHLCAAEWTAFVGMILHENKSFTNQIEGLPVFPSTNSGSRGLQISGPLPWIRRKWRGKKPTMMSKMAIHCLLCRSMTRSASFGHPSLEQPMDHLTLQHTLIIAIKVIYIYMCVCNFNTG